MIYYLQPNKTKKKKTKQWHEYNSTIYTNTNAICRTTLKKKNQTYFDFNYEQRFVILMPKKQ